MSFLDRVMGAPLLLGRRRRPRAICEDPRILVIRRNRMGDMLCTLPLLRALRARYPAARIVVACDEAGEPIARACPVVDAVIPLRRGSKLWLAPFRYLIRWQDFDWVIAAKAGYDARLGRLAFLTHAARRIGYQDETGSDYYTDSVPLPPDMFTLHQIEATLGLLAPLGIPMPADPTVDLGIELPPEARAFAESVASQSQWSDRMLVLVNVSSTTRLCFRESDLRALIAELGARPDLAVVLVGLPADLPRARRLAEETGGRVNVIATPGSLELAALIALARVLLTAEGGAAHLAAAVGTSAVVLWSEGPFEKWRSRGLNHTFVRLQPGENEIPLERVRAALEPHLENSVAITAQRVSVAPDAS